MALCNEHLTGGILAYGVQDLRDGQLSCLMLTNRNYNKFTLNIGTLKTANLEPTWNLP